MPEINFHHIDNLEFMKTIPDDYTCLTITSPPYNLGEKHHTGNKVFKPYDYYSDDLPEPKYQDNQIKVLNEILRITKVGGSLMYNHKNRIKGGKQITPYEWLLKTNWTIKQEIVWFNRSQNFDKCRFYPMTERIYWLSKGVETEFNNEINSHDILNFQPEGIDKEHKRAFPLQMVKSIIKCFPTSNIVFDPYCGSGTTALAAYDMGKEFIGTEISKKYYELSVKRFNDYKKQLKIQFPI